MQTLPGQLTDTYPIRSGFWAALGQRPASEGWKPALALMLLSPAMAELLSSSSPPAEYFSAFGLLFMPLSYGAAALLMREFAVRSGLSSWGRLQLALLMGVYIEGIICKSLFSEHWPDFGALEGYGRWLGVNWVWLVGLLGYHATQSFLLPWLALDLALPRFVNKPLLSRRAFCLLAALALFAGLLGFFNFPQTQGDPKDIYRPGVLGTTIAFGSLLLIPWIAERFRSCAAGLARAPVTLNPRLLGIGAFIAVPLFQFVPGGIVAEALHGPALAAIALALLIGSVPLMIARQLEGRMVQSQRFAVLAGTQCFWLLVAFTCESDPKRHDDPSGMRLVGLCALTLLLFLSYRLRQVQRTQLLPAAQP